MSEARLTAVAFKEGDAWIVQGIEHDIVAHAWDPADLPDVFMRAVAENMCISESMGREGLAGIKPAPAKFREMFERARASVSAVNQVIPPKVPVKGVDIRLLAGAAA